jgi:V8-like Glu-specific endopeptidase
MTGLTDTDNYGQAAFRGRNVALALAAPWRTIEHQKFAVASIIDEDERVFELSTTRLPGRLVCALKVWRNESVSYGTAWLAGPRLAITAGHCLHEAGLPEPDRVELIPGLAEDSMPFGSVQGERWDSAQRWKSDKDWRWDIGHIVLAEPLGNRLGWFGLKPVGDTAALSHQTISVAGYPETDGRHDLQRIGIGRVAGVKDVRLYHDVDTSDGQSGGPIWLNGGGNDAHLVVGVHGKEAESVDFPGFETANSGVPFSSESLALIAGWSAVL